MHYLYGSKRGGPLKLTATFNSEQQLLAYVRWATLGTKGDATKFEQGSVLAGYDAWEQSSEPLTEDDPETAIHSPTPNMM